MTPEQWTLAERLYHEAAGIAVADRGSWLARACGGDEVVRQEVESLLAQDASLTGLLDGHALDQITPEAERESLVGRQLGGYEFLSLIDEGGMGQVYRARDLTLPRDVAVKVISPEFTHDAVRRVRFRKEADVLAGFAHPHIAHIYAFVEAEGRFLLAMELVRGESLAERIARGPLRATEALDIARQVADALDAAHEQGVIHRDLKPANIRITPDGVAKVLDFGLAASERPAPASAGTTITRTAPGTLLGTVAYMSPEQARGETVDKRTDIWAFGCVLFEMLTGRKAFSGPTATDVLAAIVDRQPDWSLLPPALPEPIVALLRRCLEKDRKRRLRDIGEARIALDAPFASAETSVPDRPRSGPKGQRIAIAIAVLLVVLFGATYFLKPGTRAPDFQVEQLTTSGTADAPAITPDGNYVVYVERGSGRDSLRQRHVVTGSSVELVAPEVGTFLRGATVTPDGAFVNFVRQVEGQALELWQVPLLRGSSRPLLQAGQVDFSPSGDRMAYVRQAGAERSELVVASSDGRKAHVVASRRSPNFFWGPAPAWSSDGATIAVLGGTAGESPTGQIVFVDVNSGKERTADKGPTQMGAGVAWLDDDTLLASMLDRPSAPRQLWLVSPADRTFLRLTNDTNDYRGISVSADGNAVVTARGESSFSIWTKDSTATTWSQAVPTRRSKAPVGNSVRWIGEDLVYVSSSSSGFALSRWRASTQSEELIAQGGGNPSVSRDGSLIFFLDYDSREFWRRDATGQNRPLRRAGLSPETANVTPDGRHYVTVNLGPAGARTILLTALDDPNDSRAITSDRVRDANSPLAGGRVEVSRDAQWIAYPSVGKGNQNVTAVCDVETCSFRREFPAWARWRWQPDSTALVYVDPKTVSDLWVQPLDGSEPRRLTYFEADGHEIWGFDWSADGRRLAVARGKTSTDIVLFRGLRTRR